MQWARNAISILFLFQPQNLHPLSSQMVLLTLAHTKNTQLLNRLYTTLYHELPPMGGYDQVVNSLNYYIAFLFVSKSFFFKEL